MKHLVIVESPTKAKTIRKYLGSDYVVTASMGHVRDLPSSSADIPASVKKEKWAQLGVNVDAGFEPLYVIPKTKTKTITELKKLLKDADELYLATDEDREGESISWHLLELLKPKVPVHRMVFHEITEHAIKEALAHPRSLDENLVHAQETRRILDRLVGYSLSPVLWKKITYGLSAGRVQSVALKAIIDRERARMAFKSANYFDVLATLEQDGTPFEAELVESNGKKLITGKDFDENTGLSKDPSLLHLREADAQAIAEEVRRTPWKILSVQEKSVTRKPPAPFTTSTLQQEANRKLGLGSKDTMKVAQSLYEHGFITYMRTDSVALSSDAIASARKHIVSRFGAEFLPEAPRHYTTTAKGAQEAHEAIRPSLTFAAPHDTPLAGKERDLYELIWMRTLASQMTDSAQQQVTVRSTVGRHVFQSNGMRITFAGFLRAYVEGAEDTDQALAEKEHPLPVIHEGDTPACTDAKPVSHETKPPARFTEASLIQYMEKEGIGRPSTYASIIGTLNDRGYVAKLQNALVPSFTGMAVIQLLEKHFQDLVDAGFTSKMEASLDDIAEGKQEWLPYLTAFFLGDHGLRARIAEEADRMDTDAAKEVRLPNLPDITVRIGKFGAYFEAIHPRSKQLAKASVPEGVAPADLTMDSIESILSSTMQGPTTLGDDPTTGLAIFLKTGSYGPYLQLGEDPEEDSKKKPKRVSVPKNIPLTALSHDRAVALLNLPRLVGIHPTTGKEIRAGLGRFGPYVVHDGDFRSLKEKEGDDVFTITLERALALFAQPKGAGRSSAPALKTLGAHPKDGKPITVHQGKYGMYVKHGAKNATLPKDMTADMVTLEQAIELLAARKTVKKRAAS